MSIVKIRTNRQVTIPKEIFDELGLEEGEYVEVSRSKNHIVIKPKKLVDADDVLSPEEEEIVKKGIEQIRRGEHVSWEELKNEMGD